MNNINQDKAHIIFVIDTSRSMIGSRFESTLEAIHEIKNSIDCFDFPLAFSLITFSNTYIVVDEHVDQINIPISSIKIDNGLSNLHVAYLKSCEISELYKEPTWIIVVTDFGVSSFSSDFYSCPYIRSKIALNVGGYLPLPHSFNDFVVFSNTEDQLNELCKKILSEFGALASTTHYSYDERNTNEKHRESFKEHACVFEEENDVWDENFD